MSAYLVTEIRYGQPCYDIEERTRVVGSIEEANMIKQSWEPYGPVAVYSLTLLRDPAPMPVFV